MSLLSSGTEAAAKHVMQQYRKPGMICAAYASVSTASHANGGIIGLLLDCVCAWAGMHGWLFMWAYYSTGLWQLDQPLSLHSARGYL
jgi:hypothetical protein